MREQIFFQPFWQWSIFQNTLEEYVIAALLFIVFFVGLKILRSVVFTQLRKLVKKTDIRFLHFLVEGLYKLHPWFLSFLAIYAAVSTLQLYSALQQALDWILVIWVGIQAVKILQNAVDQVVENVASKQDDAESETALGHLAMVGKIVLWIIAVLMILSNMGIEITSLIAGLGIGGIAIAFAVQNILSDLFGSFAIFFDKPFVKGDFIVIGENSGTVEKVGIKTTRIRALQGEEVIISNKELTSARIQNFKRLTRRRIAFDFGIIYESKNAALRKIPTITEKIITDVEQTDFSRTHFKSFGDSALIFETVYFVDAPDYKTYMDAQQEINFQLKEALEKNKTPMAYPTQTLYMQKVS
ncbi:MAG: mechanosensitive ion channel family protein [Patescibacteria group bacterium]